MARVKEISYSCEAKIASPDYSRIHGRWNHSETIVLEEGDDAEEEFEALRKRVQGRVGDDVAKHGPNIDPSMFEESGLSILEE